MDEVQQRREDAWAALKKMHDQANGIVELVAAGGWCAPSEAVYGADWQPGIYAGTYVGDITP